MPLSPERMRVRAKLLRGKLGHASDRKAAGHLAHSVARLRWPDGDAGAETISAIL